MKIVIPIGLNSSFANTFYVLLNLESCDIRCQMMCAFHVQLGSANPFICVKLDE